MNRIGERFADLEDFASGTGRVISALDRARSRIPWGEPGEEDSFWDAIPAQAFLKVSASDLPLAATTLRAVAGERRLHLRFDCAIEDWFASVSNMYARDVGEREHVFCEISPQNDPTDVWRIASGMTRAAEPRITRIRRINGEASLGASYDEWSIPVAIDSLHRVETHWGVSSRAWWLEWMIPWKAMGLDSRPVTLGFRYGRGQCACAQDPMVILSGWPHGRRPSNCAPLLEHGEALIGPCAGAPLRVEFEQPVFGMNRGTMIVGEDWAEAPRRLRVGSLDPDGKVFDVKDFEIPEGAKGVPFVYRLDRRHSSHLEPERVAKISLEVFGARGDGPLYQARLPMDRHLGLCVDEPYEVCGEPEVSGDSREGWLRRIVGALPRLHRVTTEQGAPSDFCLASTDGAIAVNLMSDDPWETMAALIEQRFSSGEDRLVGAMALIGQKSVTNLLLDPNFFNAKGQHTYHSPQHELMGPLSVIRYGGGSAMCRAAVLAALLQRVNDPLTGKPFVTRVIGLSNNGGPSQTHRQYRGCAGGRSLAPFVQEPGRVGVTAVNYRDSQILLDPTALAFFPLGKDCLATVEEIVADKELRKTGAGRLAPCYAGLDIEELRRQPIDRLLSKGVLPELALDEDGANHPPDTREYHAPHVILAGASAPNPEVWSDTMGRYGTRHGAVSVKSEETGLQVAVCINGVDFAHFNSRDREMESLHLVIDAAHGHLQFFHFEAGLTGLRDAWLEEATGIQRLLKHLSTENHIEIARVPAGSWSCEIEEEADGYRAVFFIPWVCLNLENEARRSPVLGFNAWVNCRHPYYGQFFLVPPRFRSAADPISFADLYLDATPLVVKETDFATPFWGENEGALVLANHGTEDALVEIAGETRLSLRRWTHQEEKVMLTVPAGKTMRVCFPYVTNPEEKFSGGQKVQVSVRVDGRERFRGEWLMTYHHVVTVRHRYGSELGVRENPKLGETDFLQRKIDYICSRVPLFHRKTTRDGAASDFVLCAEDASVEWNLMKPDTLDQIARYIEGRFDNDFDRLLGMLYLACNPAIKRHQSAGHRFLTGAGPLSIIRANFAGFAGNCGYAGPLFAGMADRLRLGGKKLGTHPNGLVDHLVSAVDWDGRRIILDADTGHFNLKADGSDFATIEDFRNSAEILSTAGPGDRVRYYFFRYSRTAHQLPYDYSPYPGVFPLSHDHL